MDFVVYPGFIVIVMLGYHHIRSLVSIFLVLGDLFPRVTEAVEKKSPGVKIKVVSGGCPVTGKQS